MKSSANKSQFKRLENIAFSLADWNSSIRCKHFSFILNKKKIVAIGTNQKKTHPTNLKNKKISHDTGKDVSHQKYTCSEFNAIIKLKKTTNIDTKKCTLVNLRYDRNQQIALASPCMSCKSLLNHYKFKAIFFADNDGNYQMYK